MPPIFLGPDNPKATRAAFIAAAIPLGRLARPELDRLSRDEHRMIRAAVAQNPCCPEDFLEMLSLDRDGTGLVQQAVLNNRSSSERAQVWIDPSWVIPVRDLVD